MAGLKTSVLSATISIALAIPAPVFAAETKKSSSSGSKSSSSGTDTGKSVGNADGLINKAKGLFSGLFGGSDPATDKAETIPSGLESHKIIGEKVAETFQSESGSYIPETPAILKAFEKYNSNWQNCIDKQSSAATWCLESNNSDLQNALSSINMLASTSGLASVTDSCSTMGKIMNIGSAALTAYSAQCGLWRSACALSCVASRGGAEEMKALVAKAKCVPKLPPNVPDPGYTKCESLLRSNGPLLVTKIGNELKPGLDKSIANKTEKCTSQYVALLGSAALGLANLKKTLGDSKSCEEESSATNTAQTLADKCADAANANLPECICLANPRTAGCSNGLTTVGEANAGQGQAVSPTIASGGDLGAVNLPGGGDSTSTMGENVANNSGDSGGGIGAPMGGGGSGLGGTGGGSGGGPGEKGAGGKAGLNTDILSGAGGGGGGGYGSYGSHEDSGGNGSGYRNYLPGGSKDPARGLAGQAIGPKDVTGQAGKSNWEKVRDRYLDNKNTLLGN